MAYLVWVNTNRIWFLLLVKVHRNSRCDIKLQIFEHWVVISYFTSLGCLDRVVDNPVCH
jgi:hypothetical protein